MRPKNRYTFPPARHIDEGKPTMVVDTMGLAYAAMHTYSKLTHKGTSTAMIYGIPAMIRTLLMTLKPGKLILVWDGERDPNRLSLLPGYKSHRDKKRDPKVHAKFHEQIAKVRKLFNRLGVAQAYHPAIEGDDMVYKVVKVEQMLNKVIIISGDKDFSQLINRDVKIFNPRTKSPLSYHTFKIDHNCEGDQFIDYLCLLGDTSDDIPGISGIGQARARKFLETYGSIYKYLKSKDDWPGMIDKEHVEMVWKRNRALIDLGYFDRKYNQETPITWYRNKKSPEFNEKRVKHLLYKYNMKTYLDPRFLNLFKEL